MVGVHQVVHDISGNLLVDTIVYHAIELMTASSREWTSNDLGGSSRQPGASSRCSNSQWPESPTPSCTLNACGDRHWCVPRRSSILICRRHHDRAAKEERLCRKKELYHGSDFAHAGIGHRIRPRKFDSAAFARQTLASWQNLAGVIDHTLLKPDATREQVENLCDEAHPLPVCLRHGESRVGAHRGFACCRVPAFPSAWSSAFPSARRWFRRCARRPRR